MAVSKTTKPKAKVKKKTTAKKEAVIVKQEKEVPFERITEIWCKASQMCVKLLNTQGLEAKAIKDEKDNTMITADCPTVYVSWAFADAIIAMRDAKEITHEEAKATLWKVAHVLANMETGRMQQAIQNAVKQIDPAAVVEEFKKAHKVH